MNKAKLVISYQLLVISILINLTIGIIGLKSKVLAVSPTKVPPTPTLALLPTSIDDDKVNDIREAIKEKVNQIKDKIEKRAYVGTIKEMSTGILIINNFRGQQQVKTDEITVVFASNKKEIQLKDLAIGDKVIILGTINGDGILKAVRITVVAPTTVVVPKREIYFGQVLSVDAPKLKIIFSTEGKESQTKSFSFDSKTKLITLPGSTDMKIKDIKPKQRAAIIVPQTTTNPTIKSVFVLD